MVITNKVVIDRDVMDACPELELVCIVATGMNNVDLDYAAKKGIAVKNVAGYSTESVTQCTFAMLFYLLNSSAYYDDYVKSGQYAESPVFTHLGREFRELKDKLFGIIGMGTIGKRVAQVAQAFGARVAYTSTSGNNLESVRLPASAVGRIAAHRRCGFHSLPPERPDTEFIKRGPTSYDEADRLSAQPGTRRHC